MYEAARRIYKNADINDTIKSSTDSYEIIYKDGYSYIGKGGFDRAMTSARQHTGNLDNIQSINRRSAPDDKTAFIDQYLRQKEFGGVLSSNPELKTHNKIWSPVKRYYGD